MLLHGNFISKKDIMPCRKKILVQGKINEKLIVVLEWEELEFWEGTVPFCDFVKCLKVKKKLKTSSGNVAPMGQPLDVSY